MNIALIALIVVLLLSAWLFPSATPALALVLLFCSLGMAFFVVFRSHRSAYRQGQITRARFVRNIGLDILGILLAVTLAILLTHYFGIVLAKPNSNQTLRLLAGIILGLLMGIGVGLLVTRFWRRLVKTAPQR